MRTAALLLLVCGSAAPQSGVSFSFFQTTTFGMVGLAPHQVIRLNVLNPGGPAFAGKPKCGAEMSFLNQDGAVIKSSAPAVVDDDKALALELDRTELTPAAGRIPVRARLRTAAVASGAQTQPQSPIMPGSVCSFLPTVEIFDKDTGKTTIVMTEGRTLVLTTPGGAPRLPR